MSKKNEEKFYGVWVRQIEYIRYAVLAEDEQEAAMKALDGDYYERMEDDEDTDDDIELANENAVEELDEEEIEDRGYHLPGENDDEV